MTAFTGYYLFSPDISVELLMVSLGVLILASAASALNQLQEIPQDARMDRTKNRPLPSNILKPSDVLIFVITCLIAGCLLLYFFGSFLALSLGLFTILWYNGIYTWLKKITAFAVIPGSITGAIPPVIGWTAAGGSIDDKTSIMLAFIFFIGQVPHFWLLLLQYGNQYQKAGFPNIAGIFSEYQIRRLTFIWVLASLASSLLLSVFGIMNSGILALILLSMAVITIYYFRKLLVFPVPQEARYKNLFILLNSYFLLIMILLILDKSFA
jgi:protoheme IX farnesyltransferase